MSCAMEIPQFCQSMADCCEVAQHSFNGICCSCFVRDIIWRERQLLADEFDELWQISILWCLNRPLLEYRLAARLHQFLCGANRQVRIVDSGGLHSRDLLSNVPGVYWPKGPPCCSDSGGLCDADILCTKDGFPRDSRLL